MKIQLSVLALFNTCLLVAKASILNSDADAFIQEVLSTFGSPGGLSVAVVRKDSATSQWSRETKGYGKATLAGDTVTEKTQMSIGSNSKACICTFTSSTTRWLMISQLFLALGTGLLVNNETISPRLDWKSKLADILPGFGLEDPVATKQTSIIDALAHRTGMPRHDFALKITDDIPTLIEKMKYQRPSAEFRDIWQYSNEMYSILSYLPTVLLPSKIPYARYIKEHIIDPLGMNSTSFSTDFANNTGLLADGLTAIAQANGTRGPALAIPYWITSGDDGNALSGPGGIISNAEDLATWLQFLLLSGVNPATNETVVPSSVFDDIKQGVSIEKAFSDIVGGFPEFSPIVYSAGQESGSYRGIAYIEHTGGVPGFQSVIIRCPNDNLGIAIVSNDDDLGTYIVQIVKFWLFEQAFGFTKTDWISRIQAYAATLTSSTTPRPANATFPGGNGNISSLGGQYNNKGYGTVEFCYAASTNSSSTSSSCKALLETPEVKSILSGTPANVPTLVAEWDSPFASHFVMNHFNGLVFNFTGYILIPNHGTNQSLYAEARVAGGVVEFDQQLDGFGVTGGFWGAGDGILEPIGSDVKERAEVWFDKLN